MERPAREAVPAVPSGPRFARVPLDRRRFLIVMAGAGAYAALRPYAALARRAGVARPPLQPWSLPSRLPDDELGIAQALIAAAVLAPSHWNTQPWRFEVDGALIRMYADPRRTLPIVDPDRRAQRIALGAALENLLVAARAWGLRPTVTYAGPEEESGLAAEITWVGGEPARDRALFHAIVERRTNRGDYDERGLYAENRAALTAQVSGDFRIHWIDDRARIEALGQLAYDAVHEQVMDKRSQAERYAWMRFDDQARERGDGLSMDALELGGPTKWFARRLFNPRARLLGQGARGLARQARGGVRSAGALALLSMPAPREDAWLAGGQIYERLALKATQLGIAHQPIHAPIEQALHRAELLRRFDAAGEQPLMFVRFGHAKRSSGRERRGVALVASLRGA